MKIQVFIQRLVIVCFIMVLSFSLNGQNIENTRYFMQNQVMPNSSQPYGNNKKHGHYLKSVDANIYYEVYGEGKPLVVLHGGIVGSTKEMGQFIDSLSKNHKVIAISTRGHGKSEIGHILPSYDQKAKDVNAVISKETNDKVIVLGFSDGAYTGYFFAKNYPGKISKLIAIGAGEWKKGFRRFNMSSEIISSADSLYWQQQLSLRPEPERVDEWFHTLNDYYSSLEISTTMFKEVKCPVLLLAGEKDENAPLSTIMAAYDYLPNAQLGIIPNAPHPAFITNFPAVWFCIAPFLKQKTEQIKN
ncbi:alpha/beta fold hydrolase [Sinomicrobium sp. M5D2P17]